MIDADNVSAKSKPITDSPKYGTVTYKRIYGDWTLTLHAKWKTRCSNSITPILQFGYTQGKNATDSAMIDAMDILYTRRWSYPVSERQRFCARLARYSAKAASR